ncbi:MAG: HEAT repeat domain-containing protein [Planctomycetota bacterium]|jgi:hypothetical protein
MDDSRRCDHASGTWLVVTCCIVLGGCAARRSRPPSCAPSGEQITLNRAFEGEEEGRYRAIRDLVRADGPAVRAALARLLEDESPMIRNAAARSLCDLGERHAGRVLIANLHRDARTFVATDAIHHLRATFGTDLGYDPNRGYRHQTEKVAAWWAWWAGQPFGGRPPEPESPGRESGDLRERLAEQIDAFEAAAFPDAGAEAAAVLGLWTALAELAPSRAPPDLDVLERGFALLSARRPSVVDLWNNHALIALNAGHHEAAEASYRRALALAPEDAQLHNDVGILLEGLGRLDEAEAAYRRAARLAPEDDVARANLADVLAARGRGEEAIRAYREAERLAPEKWTYHRLWIRRLTR